MKFIPYKSHTQVETARSGQLAYLKLRGREVPMCGICLKRSNGASVIPFCYFSIVHHAINVVQVQPNQLESYAWIDRTVEVSSDNANETPTPKSIFETQTYLDKLKAEYILQNAKFQLGQDVIFGDGEKGKINTIRHYLEGQSDALEYEVLRYTAKGELYAEKNPKYSLWVDEMNISNIPETLETEPNEVGG